MFSAKFQVLKWRHNHSQSPVLYPTGSEISRFWYVKTRGRKIDYFFATFISTLGRFYRANKNNSVIHTLT